MSSVARFLETLEKMGATPVVRGAGYMQLRQGTRPFRAHTLLARSSDPHFYKRLDLPSSSGPLRQLNADLPNAVVLPPSSMTSTPSS